MCPVLEELAAPWGSVDHPVQGLDRVRAQPREQRVERHQLGLAAGAGGAPALQAQQVADQLVEEAVARAQEIIAEAHVQQREILQSAPRAAEAAAREAAQASARNMTTYVSASAPEVEYARRFTRVAQVQLRTVLEALVDQVEQLGQVSRLWQQSPLATYAVDEMLAVDPLWDASPDAIPAQVVPSHRAAS